MAVDVRVEGADKLRELSQALKKAGLKDLRSELFRSINRTVKPLRQTAKGTPTDRPGLPRSGGLAQTVASGLRRGVRTRRRTGRNPGISIVGSASGHDLSAMNRGRLRHPLFGNRAYWYTQTVTPGFWDKPLEREAPKVREELIKAFDEMSIKIKRAVE